MNTKLAFIGFVRSPLKSVAAAPKQAENSLPEAEIKLLDQYLPALYRMEPGDRIVILTWLDQADRSVLQCHPRGDESRPKRGVFTTRSPDRPNPIGLHEVELRRIEGNVLTVHPLEAVDGTPVLDIKKTLTREHPQEADSDSAAREIIRIAALAWQKGMLNGFNGNVSVRNNGRMLITGTGSAKGFLTPEDLAEVDLDSGDPLGGARPSSEAGMHLAIYRAQPEAKAVVHTHPPHLLALSLAGKDLSGLSLFEAGAMAGLMTPVPAHSPGSFELARAVSAAAREHRAVFMHNHGLTCWGPDLVSCLAVSEELESLARIQLMHGWTEQS